MEGGGRGWKGDKIWVFIYSNFWQNLWKNTIEKKKKKKTARENFLDLIWLSNAVFVFFLAHKLTKP